VHQQQIDGINAEAFQTGFCRTLKITIAQFGMPHLGGQEVVVSGERRCSQALAHRLFVLIHRSGVDMPITIIQRMLHEPARLLAL